MSLCDMANVLYSEAHQIVYYSYCLKSNVNSDTFLEMLLPFFVK